MGEKTVSLKRLASIEESKAMIFPPFSLCFHLVSAEAWTRGRRGAPRQTVKQKGTVILRQPDRSLRGFRRKRLTEGFGFEHGQSDTGSACCRIDKHEEDGYGDDGGQSGVALPLFFSHLFLWGGEEGGD